MPQVTDIKQQKRRQDRFSIFIDEKYAFSLGELELAASKLSVGDSLGLAEIEKLKQDSEFGKALEKSYNYLSYRPRSTKEMETYLSRKKFSEDAREEVIERLKEQGYLNDQRFAADWVVARQSNVPKSVLALRQELLQKGIDRQIIEDTLGPIYDQHQDILALVETRRLLQRYPDQNKLVQYLANQGFKYDQIKRALTELNSG